MSKSPRGSSSKLYTVCRRLVSAVSYAKVSLPRSLVDHRTSEVRYWGLHWGLHPKNVLPPSLEHYGKTVSRLERAGTLKKIIKLSKF